MSEIPASGWEPECHILDKGLIRSFLRKRKIVELNETCEQPVPQRVASRRSCVPIAAERARLMSNADRDAFADEASSSSSDN